MEDPNQKQPKIPPKKEILVNPVINHPWRVDKKEATKIQNDLSKKVLTEDKFNKINLVGGVDVAYEKNGEVAISTVIVLEPESLKVVEIATSQCIVTFPYTPGLFSFREIPPLIEAFSKLSHIPDLIICDGQGIAHPRRFGLASHLGVLFNIPSIGCGKKNLIGASKDPGLERGCFSDIIDNGEVIGRALRTQKSKKPIYISIGHRVSLETATHWILKLSQKYRLPETTRIADQAVRAALNQKPLNLQ